MMIKREVNSDGRLDASCNYCGNAAPVTKDHVPSKILLDAPLPENTPWVLTCKPCNIGYSLDEEYFACLLECTICGTTEIEKLRREKIKKTLRHSTGLHEKLKEAMTIHEGHISFKIEEPRIKNVLLKLARGHAKFENSEPMLGTPRSIVFMPLHTSSEKVISDFLSPEPMKILPEIGSRMLSTVVVGDGMTKFPWHIVQSGAYDYSVVLRGEKVIVRMLIWNFLMVEVIWN